MTAATPRLRAAPMRRHFRKIFGASIAARMILSDGLFAVILLAALLFATQNARMGVSDAVDDEESSVTVSALRNY